MSAANKIDTKRNINMKKTLIICSVFLLFAVTSSAQTPTYKELSATAYRLLKGQDYIGAHKWDLDAMGDVAGVTADSSYSRFHNLNTLGGRPAMWRHGDIQAAGFPRGQVEGVEPACILLYGSIQVFERLAEVEIIIIEIINL